MTFYPEPEHRPSAPRLPAAGWLPDPSETDLERYWNGSRWTPRTRNRFTRLETGVVPDPAPQRRSRRERAPRDGRSTGSKLSTTLLIILGLAVSYQWVNSAGYLPAWATPTAVVAAFGEPEAFETDYPVFGSTELVNHLERGMIAQESSIDITYWFQNEGQAGVEDALFEAGVQNPYLFVAGWGIRQTGSLVFLEPDYTYGDEEAERRRSETRQAVQAGLAASGANAATTETEKATLIHDYIVTLADYDMGAFEAIERGDSSAHVAQSQEAYGIFVFGTAVCNGYAQAFTAMAESAGLDAVMVTGSDSSGDTGGDHAWNKVRIDGRWLLVDTTWDDPVGAPPGLEVRRDYLLVADDHPLLATRTADSYWAVDANLAGFAS
ncbi:transglutaminase domain-containing protein [Demequina sp. SO4-13]|uniref:transglutaminase domain-containing protein n=1 Tax=Demequina sp. SO4-13 TaxID=3401027 RepID=UPI003AF93770